MTPLEAPPAPCLAAVRSPKSDALPVVDMVVKSIEERTLGLPPPPVTPLSTVPFLKFKGLPVGE